MQTTDLPTTQLGDTAMDVTTDQVDPLVAAASLELSADDVSHIEGAG
jgi:hypothetical protein